MAQYRVALLGSDFSIGGPGGSPINPVYVSTPTANFGDGSDGALVFDGTTTIAGIIPASNTYTLPRPLFASTMVVNAGVTIKPANWPIFATTSVTINATGLVDHSGGAGTALGVAGASAAASLYAATTGGTGNSGAGGVGAGGAGFYAGASGAGGVGSGGAAGAGGSPSSSAQPKWPYRQVLPMLTGIIQFGAGSKLMGGTPGGGGGSGDGTNKGGGGGASGGLISILTPTFVNLGTVTSNGGAGGSPATGNAGGGGGGAGGIIVVVTTTAWTSGTMNVLHGNGGSGVGTGTAGGNGSDGNTLNVII